MSEPKREQMTPTVTLLKRAPVESSALRSYGYDAETQTLDVEFTPPKGETEGAMRLLGLADRLRALDACDPAVKWVASQPDQRPEMLWPACRDGSWLLWALERAGIDCSELGFVCAERARQSALRALPSSPERDALAACAPIVDRETSLTALAAAARAAAAAEGAAARAAMAAEEAAWVPRSRIWAAAMALRAAAAAAAATAEGAAARAAMAAWAVSGARGAAKASELAAIADLVRERWPVPPREVLEMLGGEK